MDKEINFFPTTFERELVGKLSERRKKALVEQKTKDLITKSHKCHLTYLYFDGDEEKQLKEDKDRNDRTYLFHSQLCDLARAGSEIAFDYLLEKVYIDDPAHQRIDRLPYDIRLHECINDFFKVAKYCKHPTALMRCVILFIFFIPDAEKVQECFHLAVNANQMTSVYAAYAIASLYAGIPFELEDSIQNPSWETFSGGFGQCFESAKVRWLHDLRRNAQTELIGDPLVDRRLTLETLAELGCEEALPIVKSWYVSGNDELHIAADEAKAVYWQTRLNQAEQFRKTQFNHYYKQLLLQTRRFGITEIEYCWVENFIDLVQYAHDTRFPSLNSETFYANFRENAENGNSQSCLAMAILCHRLNEPNESTLWIKKAMKNTPEHAVYFWIHRVSQRHYNYSQELQEGYRRGLFFCMDHLWNPNDSPQRNTDLFYKILACESNDFTAAYVRLLSQLEKFARRRLGFEVHIDIVAKILKLSLDSSQTRLVLSDATEWISKRLLDRGCDQLIARLKEFFQADTDPCRYDLNRISKINSLVEECKKAMQPLNNEDEDQARQHNYSGK